MNALLLIKQWFTFVSLSYTVNTNHFEVLWRDANLRKQKSMQLSTHRGHPPWHFQKYSWDTLQNTICRWIRRLRMFPVHNLSVYEGNAWQFKCISPWHSQEQVNLFRPCLFYKNFTCHRHILGDCTLGSLPPLYLVRNTKIFSMYFQINIFKYLILRYVKMLQTWKCFASIF